MLKVRWDLRAGQDLVRLHEFLARENPQAANAAIDKIIEATRLLADFPDVGKQLPKTNRFREWTTAFGDGAFVLRYRVHPGSFIAITRVWHSREHHI